MSVAEEQAGAATSYEELAPLFDEFAGLAPDEPRRAQLRDELVTAYLPLARTLARRFANRGESLEDLVQVATLGLIGAIDRFDPTRGVDFVGFAVPTITGELRRHFRDSAWSLRVPRRTKEAYVAIQAAIAELTPLLQRSPTPGELAEHLDLPVDQVREGLRAAYAYRSSSLDKLLNEDTTQTLGSTMGEDDPQLEQVDLQQTVQPLLRTLPERERTVVVLRFFHGMSQSQIASRVGVSQMQISRILSRTLAQLRDRLFEDG